MDMAYYLSYLESVWDFNTEYDFIHPDARAIIPRAAVVGWFQDNYAPRNPQPAVIHGVEFVSWTWDVTGVTYPYTAQVSFSQQFNDGLRSDVVRLVQDQNGVWRWFFGRSREFVEQTIAYYSPTVPNTPHTGESWIDESINDVSSYWDTFFQAEPQRYDDPRVVVFDQATSTGCGVIDPLVDGPLYCGRDESVYLNVFFLQVVSNDYGPLVATIVIAHEYAHHVQNELVLNTSSILASELQADCLAGAWARDYATRFHLAEADIVAAMNLMILIGGDVDHGLGSQRVKEFLVGFYDGSQACF
ncbi:MAG: neutral zinc metallopeptidase [Thermomicrobiales bacterium]